MKAISQACMNLDYEYSTCTKYMHLSLTWEKVQSITFLFFKFWNNCSKKLVETGNDQGPLNYPPPPFSSVDLITCVVNADVANVNLSDKRFPSWDWCVAIYSHISYIINILSCYIIQEVFLVVETTIRTPLCTFIRHHTQWRVSSRLSIKDRLFPWMIH